MKQAYVYKNTGGNVTKEKLKLIEKYSRRRMNEDEVYIFSLVLCDNQIDRDNERFTAGALHKLAELFLGKTGIFDHNPKSTGQTARIFSTETQEYPGEPNSAGENYTCLKAEAYMVRCPKNEDLILEIEAGIKKEVSVGCSMGSITCSVCGADLKQGKCSHVKGKQYGGARCHAILDEPSDAYEWSFVAVPAQPQAGVIKNFINGGVALQGDILKMLERGGELHLSQKQCEELKGILERLSGEAEAGREYTRQLKKEVVCLAVTAQPELDPQIIAKAVQVLDTEELLQMKRAFGQDRQMPHVQLAHNGHRPEPVTDSQFKI